MPGTGIFVSLWLLWEALSTDNLNAHKDVEGYEFPFISCLISNILRTPSPFWKPFSRYLQSLTLFSHITLRSFFLVSIQVCEKYISMPNSVTQNYQTWWVTKKLSTGWRDKQTWHIHIKKYYFESTRNWLSSKENAHIKWRNKFENVTYHVDCRGNNVLSHKDER